MVGRATKWVIWGAVFFSGLSTLDRLDEDEGQRHKAGQHLLQSQSEGADQWRALAQLEATTLAGMPELERLALAGEVMGWDATLGAHDNALRYAAESLLHQPAPDRASAALAMAFAQAHVDAAQVLDSTLERAPLAPLLWRRPGIAALASSATDALGAPGEENVGAPWGVPPPDGLPWAEATLEGAIVQDAVRSQGGHRIKASTLGALRKNLSNELQAWCRAYPARSGLRVCTPPLAEMLPSAAAILRDPAVPTQGAILWGALVGSPSVLSQWAEDPSWSEEARRRAALSYLRCVPWVEAVAQASRWLEAQEPPLLPLLASLELLRLGAPMEAGAIRDAAKQQSSEVALTMGWVASILEDPSAYK